MHLVLGGARSGKSRFAEQCARDSGKTLFYIATAEARDGEMQTRIAHHREQRGAAWQLREEPLLLSGAMAELDAPGHCLLVDCLTLWLSNCLAAGRWEELRATLLDTLPQLAADVVLVSNEVGQGVVPMGELNRRFVDESGRLHQDLATRCHRVTLVTAGLPLTLKEMNTA
nr:bifunctional adenosylcobinamide kinase/adenosylcobinamide-phosphate guanylyltransferase [Parahaliea mediterranea]